MPMVVHRKWHMSHLGEARVWQVYLHEVLVRTSRDKEGTIQMGWLVDEILVLQALADWMWLGDEKKTRDEFLFLLASWLHAPKVT
jgi:hypothetical protein